METNKLIDAALDELEYSLPLLVATGAMIRTTTIGEHLLALMLIPPGEAAEQLKSLLMASVQTLGGIDAITRHMNKDGDAPKIHILTDEMVEAYRKQCAEIDELEKLDTDAK